MIPRPQAPGPPASLGPTRMKFMVLSERDTPTTQFYWPMDITKHDIKPSFTNTFPEPYVKPKQLDNIVDHECNWTNLDDSNIKYRSMVS
jgi:hypothetical protein